MSENSTETSAAEVVETCSYTPEIGCIKQNKSMISNFQNCQTGVNLEDQEKLTNDSMPGPVDSKFCEEIVENIGTDGPNVPSKAINQNVTSPEAIFHCDLCPETFMLLSRHKHLAHCVCPSCKKVFSRKDIFMEHRKPKQKKFPCNVCGISLSSKCHQEAHKKFRWMVRPVKSNVSKITISKIVEPISMLEPESNVIKPIEVLRQDVIHNSHCSQITAVDNENKDTEDVIDNSACSQITPVDIEDTSNVPKLETDQHILPFDCNQCGKSFKELQSLSKHLRVHVGDLTCTLCSKTFTKGSRFNKHRLKCRMHPNFNCGFCSRMFNKKSRFKKHFKKCYIESMANKHVFKREFHLVLERVDSNICEICATFLPSRESLNDHLFEHVGIKSYVCPHCNLTYCYKENFKKHLQNHNLYHT